MSSTTSKEIIAIVGSTGTQGSSVAKTFLSLPSWTVRCLTRSPNSSAAESLRSLGGEIVHANLDDPVTLAAAFENATAIFVNTDFWAPYGRALAEGKDKLEASKIGFEIEFRHAKNATTEATKVSTLKRFIYSALGPMSKASGGKYSHAWHWESKAAVVDFIHSISELKDKTSFIYVAIYATNAFLLPQNVGGQWLLTLPGPADSHLPVIDTANSTGKFVRALVEDEEAGLSLLAYDEKLTATGVIEAWQNVTGERARGVQLSYEQMQQATGLPSEILDGAAFLGEYKYMDGVQGKIVMPSDLRNSIEMTPLEDIFRTMEREKLLGSQFTANPAAP